MSFEYIDRIPGNTPVDWNPSDDSLVSAVARTLQSIPDARRQTVTTLHGEFLVSCTPLSANDLQQLGLSPHMSASSRFAVHIEGCWKIAEERADVVLQLHTVSADGIMNPAWAMFASSSTCVQLPPAVTDSIKRELYSALCLIQPA